MSELFLPPKKQVLEQLLRKGSVFVHFDPRSKDANVPPWLKHQAQLVLQYGYDMPIPIRDFVISDAGIQATLSFSRTPFHTFVPWGAVFGIVGDEGRGMVWPEAMPKEIKAEVELDGMGGSRLPSKSTDRFTPVPARTRRASSVPPENVIEGGRKRSSTATNMRAMAARSAFRVLDGGSTRGTPRGVA